MITAQTNSFTQRQKRRFEVADGVPFELNLPLEDKKTDSRLPKECFVWCFYAYQIY